jgi:hypothetical protein
LFHTLGFTTTCHHLPVHLAGVLDPDTPVEHIVQFEVNARHLSPLMGCDQIFSPKHEGGIGLEAPAARLFD